MYRAFRYAGSKLYLVKTIANILENIDTSNYNYVEPFLGSGAVYYNLQNKFRHAYLNDISTAIYSMHKCFLEFSYEDYDSFIQYSLENYDDIKFSKESYYNFRNDYNNGVFKEKTNLALLMLANSCINSMLRFGPNGMNQSFGHCHYIVNKNTWEHLKSKLSLASLTNTGFKAILNQVKSERNIIFVDPPYDERIMPYSLNEDYKRKDLIDLLVSLSYNSIVFYTDSSNADSDYLLDYGFKRVVTKSLKSICPQSHSEQTHNEVLYCNKL